MDPKLLKEVDNSELGKYSDCSSLRVNCVQVQAVGYLVTRIIDKDYESKDQYYCYNSKVDELKLSLVPRRSPPSPPKQNCQDFIFADNKSRM